MAGSLSTAICIEEESMKVNELVYSARQGKWDTVFSILKTHPHLINTIPEDRRWGILHQAAWWNKEDLVKKLLNLPACDSRIESKETMSEVGETGGCTPYEIAQKYGYTDIGKLLEQHSSNLVTSEQLQELPTFHIQNNNDQLKGVCLLRITLSSYKQTFCPFTFNKNKPFAEVMEEIFKYIDTNENWSTVKIKVCDSLYTVCKPAVRVLNAVNTKEEFYATIVNVYTNESTQLYTYLNTALRRQDDKAYIPSAYDLGLGPYILMFNLLLMHWNKLAPDGVTTYRRMLMTDADCKRYQKGIQFVWLSFISSSNDLKKAEPFPTCVPTGEHAVTFVIDNQTTSKWQPRNIEHYALFPEEERLYPAGGAFVVTDRSENDGKTTVHLKLLERGLATG
ncbi:Hypothetical predicted protein [Mytilus galloprovincialis]|uniref:Mono(ADP-ribosyl)transferase n=1 Tax=Mytilus galloprovincialis TaxID=29158 RepID=A0A8B6BQS1_MYTGA|nr:Hypothetical predicted protein [Mytilus galloprovincialis]